MTESMFGINNSSQIIQPTSIILTFCSFIRIVELFIHLLLLPISIIFILLILRTSILHLNLKFILLVQCASNLQYAFGRFIQIFNKLFFNVDFFAQFRPLQMSVLFAMMLGSMIGHILLLERILATIFVAKYENYRRPYFSIFTFLIMIAFSFVNSYEQAFGDSVLDVTFGTLFTSYATFVFSFVEISIIFAIGYYNDKKYKVGMFLYQRHNLSERYQLSENIRTSRQLSPTFVFHFINILMFSSITIIFYYFKGQIKDSFSIDFLFIFDFSITAFCNFSIELTIIIFHPILSRNMRKILSNWRKMILNNAKVNDANSAERGPKTINGKELIERGEMQAQYFQMLENAWK